MTREKIVITGGTGFIGKFLRHYFVNQGYKVTVVSRSQADVLWDGKHAGP